MQEEVENGRGSRNFRMVLLSKTKEFMSCPCSYKYVGQECTRCIQKLSNGFCCRLSCGEDFPSSNGGGGQGSGESAQIHKLWKQNYRNDPHGWNGSQEGPTFKDIQEELLEHSVSTGKTDSQQEIK